MRSDAPVEKIEVAAYRIPTDKPEADGTVSWTSTTLVVVHVIAASQRGVGYSYGSATMAPLIRTTLADRVRGVDALDVEKAWQLMVRGVRRLGRPGIASLAISAVDAALWDLKARLLGLPLVALLGAARDSAPIYASGGFTSYSPAELEEQLRGWIDAGIRRVKLKVGARPDEDLGRVASARAAIGDAQLMVDAGGAYERKQALAKAEAFAEHGVVWFEEPVDAEDLDGLRLLRDRAPGGMVITAGDHSFDLQGFRRLLVGGAVDALQADATRCLGITGFLAAARLAQAFGVPVSARCAPSLHCHPACAVPGLVHAEFLHSHARIESLLFDGFRAPVGGALVPDVTRPGLGLELKRADAQKYAL